MKKAWLVLAILFTLVGLFSQNGAAFSQTDGYELPMRLQEATPTAEPEGNLPANPDSAEPGFWHGAPAGQVPVSTGTEPLDPITISAKLTGRTVLYDLGHNERIYLDDGDPGYDQYDHWKYDLWRDLLVANGAVITKQLTRPITLNVLKNYNVYVIAMPLVSFTSAEISAIRSYVSDGGSVLMIGEYGLWTPYWQSNAIINAIASGWSLQLVKSGWDGPTSEIANRGDLTYGVNQVQIVSASYTSGGQAVFYNPTRTKTGMTTYEKTGRVALIGDSSPWADDFLYWEGMDDDDLAINTIYWLAGTPTQTTVQVVNESGDPQAGAILYLNGVRVPGSTGANGRLSISAHVGDKLAAVLKIKEEETAKSHHNQDASTDWAYRVYITSADVQNSGLLKLHTIEAMTDIQTLTVKKTNTLVGFNLVFSVEWDADDTYLEDLKMGIERASRYLYDASDGQMLIERATIYDNAVNWADADYQIAASNEAWPDTDDTAAITSPKSKGQIHTGRYFNGSTSTKGQWVDKKAYRMLIQEFGHYALDLYDEYYIMTGANHDQKTPSQCTLNRTNSSSPYSNFARASSLMDNTSATEFCSALSENPHNPNTEQGRKHNESNWETIVREYADEAATDRYTFITPVERGQVLDGPDTIQIPAWMNIQIVDAEAGACDFPVYLTVVDTNGNPGKNFSVWLNTGSRTIYQGRTNDTGELVLLGAGGGNTSTATSPNGKDTVTETIPSCEALDPASKNSPGVPSIIVPYESAPFDLTILTSAPDSTMLHIEVEASTALASAPQVSMEQYGADPVAVSMSLSGSVYQGDALLDTSLPAEGIVRVAASDGTSHTVTAYANFKGTVVGASEGGKATSPDQRAQVYLPENSLSGDGVVVITPVELPGPLPNEQLVLLNGPVEVSGPALTNPANLTMIYPTNGGRPIHARPGTVAVYAWTGDSWAPVGGTLLPLESEISVSITEFGIYAVMGEKEYPLFLPLVQNQ